MEKILELWERRESESDPAFSAFRSYLDLGSGNRSLRKVASILGKSSQVLSVWSAKHEWIKRVRSYDDWRNKKERDIKDEVMKEVLRESEFNVVEMNKRQSAIATALLGKVYDSIQKVENLTPMEAVKWFEAASKIERLAKVDQRDEMRKDDDKHKDMTGVLVMPSGQTVEEYMRKKGFEIEVVHEEEDS